MQKIILILIFSLLTNLSYANDDLEMHEITLYELSKLIFSHLNRIDFTADNEFINDKRGFTAIFKNKSSRQQKLEVIKMIERAGYYVDQSKKTIRITKQDFSEPEKNAPLVYKPKYRSPDYLTDHISSIFREDLTVKRPLKRTEGFEGNSKQFDNGHNGLSLVSKPTDLLFIYAKPDKINLFKQVIKQLDIPESQVQINAFMYEVKKGVNQKSSFSLIVDLFKTKLGLEFKADTATNAFKINFPNLKAVLSVLNSNSNFKLLSSPFLLTKNNQKASFNVGSEVPVLGNVTQNANGQAIQSVEYRQAGVILDITPKILEENIELTINHQISNFVLTDTGVNNTPTLIKRELSSVVNAKNNDLILLGGLNESTHSYNENKLPFLSAFFHGKSEDSENTEIMLLLSVKRI